MDFDGLRKDMVERQLSARDIVNQRVKEAFLKVPRHKFVLTQDMDSAYGDFPLPIGLGQTISQPYIVALMTQCLELTGSEKVLEVGTGSGYQAAILAELAKEVYTIECIAELSGRAAVVLKELGCANVNFKIGDGTLGWPSSAPFAGIIVTAGAPAAPDTLLKQLAEGGRLVIPLGDRLDQTLTVFKKENSRISQTQVCGCCFVPLLGKEGWH